ncbi:cellulase family glycosylhydrolase [Blastococcus sp. TML/M2B]|uniref:cellulase family glycosylhydrolase n=1 Tax=unclassified Blastococcus TaxID=2619396 RepID=UPI00190D22BE|nr:MULTISPECIES: cellulase family glycosylhydrolase [unclassified Blastococcus]MBN1091246.1 cellulase family glycosylhydrolase [Blastococcus sp. TML/M2B]MBN1095197.1 cellulase family glycosylhydrolase [Blastococcus sp. TML/C7B]
MDGVVPVAPSESLVLGVTIFAMWRDWPMTQQLMDHARDSGSSWIRVDMGWCTLQEEGPDRVSAWYQERLDFVVDSAAQRGLKLLIMVGCTPKWAGGGDDLTGFPSDPSDFTRAMTYLASRYQGRVAAWEIWNEPDCRGGCPNGSASDYVPVLQAGYRGVRAGDPSAVVVSAGTSGNNAPWIEQMYAAGAKGFFDVLAVHPYLEPVTAPPDAPSANMVYRLTSVEAVHDVMVRYGDQGKPIWFTEFGWTTASSGERPGVDEATQAAYLRSAVELTVRRFPYVTAAFWFCMRDRDDWTPYENHFGLLRLDGSAKPSFAALQQANAWLGAK